MASNSQTTELRECPWPKQYYDRGECCGQWPCIHGNNPRSAKRDDQPKHSQTTEMTDLEIAEEQLEEWQNACRKLERMNTDLRFALAAALPGLRDLVNQECPDPDVAERDQIVLRQALKALGKSA